MLAAQASPQKHDVTGIAKTTARLPSDEGDMSVLTQVADIVLSAVDDADLAQALDEALEIYGPKRSVPDDPDDPFTAIRDIGIPLEIRKLILDRFHGILAGLTFIVAVSTYRTVPPWLARRLRDYVEKGGAASVQLVSFTEAELATINARQQIINDRFAEWHRQAVETGAPVWPFGGLQEDD